MAMILAGILAPVFLLGPPAPPIVISPALRIAARWTPVVVFVSPIPLIALVIVAISPPVVLVIISLVPIATLV